MRISDWSSDVCSSDLHPPRGPADRAGAAAEDLDPAQAAAPDGRDRGDGIPARQDEEHEVQRRVLRFDEALILWERLQPLLQENDKAQPRRGFCLAGSTA